MVTTALGLLGAEAPGSGARRLLSTPSSTAIEPRIESSEEPFPDRRPRDDRPLHGALASPENEENTWSDSGSEDDEEGDEGDENRVLLNPTHAKAFCKFIQATKQLEKDFGNVAHSVLRLGSALVLTRTSTEARDSLEAVREFFAKNAQALLGIDPQDNYVKCHKIKRRANERASPQYHYKIVDALDRLLDAIVQFDIAMSRFEEYSDPNGRSSLQNLVDQIKLMSDSLSYFGHEGDSPLLRRFLYGQTMRLKQYLADVSDALRRFIDIGIPCIENTQSRSTSVLQNAATVGIFFAGVAATTLQYSTTPDVASKMGTVNTLWLSSLVLSIGSAVNGLLAMTWRQAVFSSPARSLPWYIQFWVRQSPLALLIASVIAFLGGLTCFVVIMEYPPAIWMVSACTTFCAVGLAVVSIWFGWERWKFSVYRRQHRQHDSQHEDRPILWVRLHGVFGEFRDAVISSESLLPTTDKVGEGGDPEGSTGKASAMEGARTSIWHSIMGWRYHDNVGTSRKKHRPTGPTRPAPPPRNSTNFTAQLPRRTISGGPLMQCSTEFWKTFVVGMHLRNEYGQIRHMRFSPSGEWLVACCRNECAVYRLRGSLEPLVLRERRYTHVRHAEWSPGGRLLTMSRKSVTLWECKGKDFTPLAKVKFGAVLKYIVWLTEEDILVLTVEQTLCKIKFTGTKPVKMEQRLPPSLTVHEIHTLDGPSRVVLFASRRAPGLTTRFVDCLLVYEPRFAEPNAKGMPANASLNSGSIDDGEQIKQRLPLVHDADSISVCMQGENILVNYEDQPSELWQIIRGESGALIETEIPDTMSIPDEISSQHEKSNSNTWGEASFVNSVRENCAIACAVGKHMHIWSLTDQRHICSFPVLSLDDEVHQSPRYCWGSQSERPGRPMLAVTSGRTSEITIWHGKGRIHPAPDVAPLTIPEDVSGVPAALTSPTIYDSPALVASPLPSAASP